MKRTSFAAVILLASTAQAAKLDISSEYRLQAVSYSNISLDPNASNTRSFVPQSARLGFSIKDIVLSDHKREPESIDIVLKMRAIGIAGNNSALNAPFDRISAHYPNTNYSPFFENSYIHARNLGGRQWTLLIGRQSYRQGSGLLLDDNGAGLTGVRASKEIPWGDFLAEAFFFQAKNSQGSQSNLGLWGATLEKKGVDGTWQLNNLLEKDRSAQTVEVGACAAPGCSVSKATRWLSSVRYKMRYRDILFDGEAALQKGVATPTGAGALGNHITYNGNAQIVRAKWLQTFYKDIQGISRVVVARGSGDDPGTTSTSEAFFPSNGLRHDGLSRDGFGQFFGATPYDAFGGQSTATASGMQRGASGIITVGFGVTPPAYKGWVAEFDYFLFQADRNVGPARTLGSELDFALRYDFKETLQFKAGAAYFRSGPASNIAKSTGRRFLLETTARF